MHGSLTFKTALLFFLPLIFMTELHQISHSVVHAFLARLADPKLTLAAFSIAYAFNTTISGVNSVAIQAGISFISDRSSFWKVFRFFGMVAVVLLFTTEVVALTPLGEIMFGQWMGASTQVVRQARTASAIMGLWIIPILARNICYGLIMAQRRTILITYATVVRLASLGIFLMVWPFWLEGADVGAAALVSCMTVEALYMLIVARPIYANLAPDTGAQVFPRDMWRFSWPLMITQSTENGVPFAINFFLGQLASPDLALAAFGVVNGLVRVLLSPLRNLTQTAQALVGSREDLKVMLKFAFGTLACFVAIIFAMFYTSMRLWVLEGAMGLPLELSRYITPGIQLTFLVAASWGSSAFLRGILSAMRRTGIIAATAAIRLLVVTAVGCITLVLPLLNGTVVGVLAMAGAFAAETMVLGWRLWSRITKPEPLFPHLAGKDAAALQRQTDLA